MSAMVVCGRSSSRLIGHSSPYVGGRSIISGQSNTLGRHAEISALNQLVRSNPERRKKILRKKTTMYVVRTNKDGNICPNSMPCCECLKTLRVYNINRCVFMYNGVLCNVRTTDPELDRLSTQSSGTRRLNN